MADWLWRIWAWENVAGVTAFFRQPEGLPAKPRVSGFKTAEKIRRANPEFIFASWCGKPLDCAAISSRAGWAEIAAVGRGRICEIGSEDILQPGFRLVYGYERLKEILMAA